MEITSCQLVGAFAFAFYYTHVQQQRSDDDQFACNHVNKQFHHSTMTMVMAIITSCVGDAQWSTSDFNEINEGAYSAINQITISSQSIV